MWHLYGNTYDLTEFINEHPGGRFIIEKTKNVQDATSLFETYHAFSGIEKIQQRLEKYLVKAKVPKETGSDPIKYDYTEYRNFVAIIKNEFPTRQSIKANSTWVLFNSCTFVVYTISFYIAFISNFDFAWKCLFQLIFTLIEGSYATNFCHDGSHYAISSNPLTNNLISKICSSWVLWNSTLWFYHHVYYHHSFTGEEERDPDAHIYEYTAIYKDVLSKFKSVFDSHPKYIKHKAPLITFLLTVFPGQWFMQAFLYLTDSPFHRFMNVKLPHVTFYEVSDMLIMLLKIAFFYKVGWIQTFIHFSAMNVMYFCTVFPDHDLYENKVTYHYQGNNWMRLQVCNTGNVINDNRFYTMFYSGINYQIEHHLFPNMSSIHYPRVSVILRKYCLENNIPYVHIPTLWGAYLSFCKAVNHNGSQTEVKSVESNKINTVVEMAAK